MSHPRLLQHLLTGREAGLERLIDRALALAELDRRLKRHLPPSIADHISVANLRDDTLFLRATAAEWRSRVHFLIPQLLETLRADPAVPKVTEIRVRVTPASAKEPSRHRQGPRLSAAAASSLQAASRSMDDEGLRVALARLAARFRHSE